MTCNIQSNSFISEQRSYSNLKFVYEIDKQEQDKFTGFATVIVVLFTRLLSSFGFTMSGKAFVSNTLRVNVGTFSAFCWPGHHKMPFQYPSSHELAREEVYLMSRYFMIKQEHQHCGQWPILQTFYARNLRLQSRMARKLPIL